jgi:AcrR family transcriptional regulator
MTVRPTPRPPSESKADPSFASISFLEPQGERRRRQLVEIAARIIEQEGVDAVRIPRVAELAGVGRTAIYRYFPRREDLFAAVSNDFDERLRSRVGTGEFAAGLTALRDSAGDEMSPTTLRVFEAIWDVLDECGPAGLILRAHAVAHDDEGRDPELVDRFRGHWMAIGLPELEATLIGDSANAVLTRTYARVRRGELDRETAIRLGHRAVAALIRGLSAANEPTKEPSSET